MTTAVDLCFDDMLTQILMRPVWIWEQSKKDNRMHTPSPTLGIDFAFTWININPDCLTLCNCKNIYILPDTTTIHEDNKKVQSNKVYCVHGECQVKDELCE